VGLLRGWRRPLQRVQAGAGTIPPRTLAARLQELEEAGILERRVPDTRPPRVEYRLTDLGRRVGKTAAGLLSA
jgi:DNA-binding HxlR family transcriptional regulator